jgi:hypothetical protein
MLDVLDMAGLYFVIGCAEYVVRTLQRPSSAGALVYLYGSAQRFVFTPTYKPTKKIVALVRNNFNVKHRM